MSVCEPLPSPRSRRSEVAAVQRGLPAMGTVTAGRRSLVIGDARPLDEPISCPVCRRV